VKYIVLYCVVGDRTVEQVGRSFPPTTSPLFVCENVAGKCGKVSADSRQGSNKTDNEALNNSKTFALTTCGPVGKRRWLWACLSFKYITSELSGRHGHGVVLKNGNMLLNEVFLRFC